MGQRDDKRLRKLAYKAFKDAVENFEKNVSKYVKT